MNARQKAKKYKQEIERLKKLSVNVNRPRVFVEKGDIQVIGVSRLISNAELMYLGPDRLREILLKDLIHSKELQKYIEITCRDDSKMDEKVFRATICVLDRQW